MKGGTTTKHSQEAMESLWSVLAVQHTSANAIQDVDDGITWYRTKLPGSWMEHLWKQHRVGLV